MKKLPGPLCLFLITIMHTGAALAQEILVKDINTQAAGARSNTDYHSTTFCACGEYLYFSAETDAGTELWRTDGTAEGTIILKDVNKGKSQGYNNTVKCSGNGVVFFEGNDGTHGRELWMSDGTPYGTKLVKDVTPGPNSAITILGILDNVVYFFTDSDADNKLELWHSDGTEANTIMMPAVQSFNNIFGSAFTGTHILFTAFNRTTGKNEIWSTDGTAGNTIRILENYSFTYSMPFGNKLFLFIQDGADRNYSLWSSDGTASGTVRIKLFSGVSPNDLQKFNDKLIFNELLSKTTWISDGTEAGTVSLTTGSTTASAVIGNYFYGCGLDMEGAARLFKTDGTSLETTTLASKEVNMTIRGTLPVTGTRLIVPYHDDNTGIELGISDIDLHVNLLKDINAGADKSAPRDWAEFKGRQYFFANDGIHGTEIWSTDGTSEGTSILKDLDSGTADAFLGTLNITVSNGKLHMIATSGSNADLFTSDGTAAGTSLEHDFEPGGPMFIGKTDSDLIYMLARTFYKKNGSTSDVTLLKDLANSGVVGWGTTTVGTRTLGNKLVFLMTIVTST